MIKEEIAYLTKKNFFLTECGIDPILFFKKFMTNWNGLVIIRMKNNYQFWNMIFYWEQKIQMGGIKDDPNT